MVMSHSSALRTGVEEPPGTTARSLRVNPVLPDARWAQTAEGQFELDDLTDVSASGGSGMGRGR